MKGEKGDEIIFENIKLISSDDGLIIDKNKLLEYKVIGEIIEHIKGKKIIAFKHTPKTGYRRKIGHRQRYTKVVLKEIQTPIPKKEKSKRGAKKLKKVKEESNKAKQETNKAKKELRKVK